VGNPGLEMPPNLFLCTNFFVIAQVIIYLKSTFLPFARFVGGLLMIIRKLMAFLVVSLLLILAFAYAFWIKDSGNVTCPDIRTCLKATYAKLFDYSPEELGFTEIIFGILILIVLLNVVIAIVGEAWTAAAEESTHMFWKFRLDKISQLRCGAQVWHVKIFSPLMDKIDNLESISYADNFSWTKPPFSILETYDQYNNPSKYFCDDLSLKIIDAHSLQADMYWYQVETEKNKEKIDLKDHVSDGIPGSRISLLLKWLGYCLFYSILVVLGLPLCGIIWPKKFRAGLLSMGKSQKMIESDTNSELKQQLAETKTVIANLTQQLSETSADLRMANHRYSQKKDVATKADVN